MQKKRRAISSPPCRTAQRAADASVLAFTEHFLEAQYVWTSFLLHHLVSVRRRFGDIDSALLLTVIGLSALESLRGGDGTTAPVNAQSLSDITGIPRETVRRKLTGLARQGWIEPSPERGWRIAMETDQCSRAERDLSDMIDDNTRALARLIEKLVTIGLRGSGAA